MTQVPSDKLGLLETNDWEPDPPGGSSYTPTNSQDDTTRNPHLEAGQPPVWLNATHPDARPQTIDEILAPYGSTNANHDNHRQTPPGHINLGCCNVRAVYFNVFIAILTTCSQVGLVVTLPIYAEFVVTAGSDPYVILVWCASWTCAIFFAINAFTIVISKVSKRNEINSWKSLLPHAPWGIVLSVGVCSGFNGIFAVYASNPQRTPGYLQALLACTGIPFTFIFRYFMLRKGVSTIRLICCAMVLVGLFIASEPEIFDLTSNGQSSGSGTRHHSLTYRMMWPVCFALSMIPVALSNVLIEKGCKRQEVQNLAFLSWTGLIQCFLLLSLFWTDLIRGFGLANNIHEFSEHMRIGFQCHVGLSDQCRHLQYIPWIFIGFYMLTNFCSFLLTRYAEGALYTSIVTALATPTAALFWSVFSSDPFRYNPQFTVITAYTLAGLVLMVPGTMLYNYYASKEEKEERTNVLWKDIMSEDEIYREVE